MAAHHYAGVRQFAGRGLRHVAVWRGHWLALVGCAHSGVAGWAGTVRCSFRRLAETLDANLGTGEDTQDVMRLLLIASLANVTNAVKGLTVPEIVANLCARSATVRTCRTTSSPTHLHGYLASAIHQRQWLAPGQRAELVARVTTTAVAYLRDQATKELRER